MSIKGENLSLLSQQHPLEGENQQIRVSSLQLADVQHVVQSDLFLSRSELRSPPVLKGFRSSDPP